MKILKSKTFAIRAMATLAFALTLGACSENENEMPDTTKPKGERMTFTVSLPGAGTRLSHSDPTTAGVKVKWTADDKLKLFKTDKSNAIDEPFITKEEYITNEGKTATFEGPAVEAINYYLFGPADQITDNDQGYNFKFSFEGQTQTVNGLESGGMDHLANYDLIKANVTAGDMDNLSFTHQAALFQFNLTGLPVGTYNNFTIQSSEAEGILSAFRMDGGADGLEYVQNFSLTLNNIAPDASGNLTLWMMMPVRNNDDVLFKAGTLTLSLTDTDGSTYTNVTAITIPEEGQTYEQGKRYSMRTAMQEKTDVLSMKFAVKPTDDQKVFILPFNASTKTYTLTVNWGDGSEPTTILPGAETDDPSLAHDYSGKGDGPFQITLTTNALASEEQMPRWYFNSENVIAPMLVSIDSPMLNMASTNAGGCFRGCINLTTIPEDLFASNTDITSFQSCFIYCASLATIPEKLFASNTNAINFTQCFLDCTGLTEIPEKLFANNTKINTFSTCFKGCIGLTTIPEKLFINNTLVNSFSACFSGCASITEIPAKLFEKNTGVTLINSIFYGTGITEIPVELFANNEEIGGFASCFQNCINLTTIPAGLFANNKKVMTFRSCFQDCPKAILNSNIFCDEATQKTTRFAELTTAVIFTNCFTNVGSSLPANGGGTAPALWEYTYVEGVTSTECFKDCINVTNYDDIQAATDWY